MQKTAYELRISDWSSDVCSSDLVIVEHLAYDPVEDSYDLDILTAGQTKQDFSSAGDKLKRHIYDYALTDYKVERHFVKELDTSSAVVVYATLPTGCMFPTPVGIYKPAWRIGFQTRRDKKNN